MIISALIHGASIHMDKVKQFCATYLVADDPWPYADVDFNTLVESYRRANDPGLKKELEYRIKKMRFSPEEEAWVKRIYFGE